MNTKAMEKELANYLPIDLWVEVCARLQLAEKAKNLATEWSETGDRLKSKGEDAYEHRGEIFLECSRRLREILGQNAEPCHPTRER